MGSVLLCAVQMYGFQSCVPCLFDFTVHYISWYDIDFWVHSHRLSFYLLQLFAVDQNCFTFIVWRKDLNQCQYHLVCTLLLHVCFFAFAKYVQIFLWFNKHFHICLQVFVRFKVSKCREKASISIGFSAFDVDVFLWVKLFYHFITITFPTYICLACHFNANLKLLCHSMQNCFLFWCQSLWESVSCTSIFL